VIIMRFGKNALETIDAVKAKIASLKSSLPPRRGDRADLRPVRPHQARRFKSSGRSYRGVRGCGPGVRAVPVHLRSAFVAIVSLPLGILAAFIVMYYQGVNANIMSLGRHRHRHRRDGGCRRGG